MNAEERKRVTKYLTEGAKLREAAGMVGVAWRDFAGDWANGRRDSESGRETAVAHWYREAAAARLRVRAVRRRQAAEVAGSRESSDLLAYVRALEEEDEPFAEEEQGIREAQPLLNLSDRIEAERDPDERARMRAAIKAGSEGLYSMWIEVLRQEARPARPLDPQALDAEGTS